MGDVAPIRPGTVHGRNQGEPVPELIAALKQLLEDAQSGYLQAMSHVAITDMRSISTSWDGHCDIHDMTAGIAILTHRFHVAAEWDEQP